jgi:hypothetical protein
MADGADVEGLRALYKASGEARAFLDHAARRERDRTETTVERAQAILRESGLETARGEVVDLFQRFEALRCGKFVSGRRGFPSRFAWSVSIVSVGRAAGGEAGAVAEIPETPSTDDEPAETFNHAYHLRANTTVRIELPADLTVHEAERLANFIKTLPMEE